MSGEIDNEFDINLDVQDESADVDLHSMPKKNRMQL